MGDLAELLERLHLARSRWRTARVVQTHWTDTALWEAAHQRSGRGTSTYFTFSGDAGDGDGEPEPARPSTATYRYWFDPERQRRRMEAESRPSWAQVQVGTQAVTLDPARGPLSFEVDDAATVDDPLLEPAWLLSAFVLEAPAGPATVAGRPGRSVRGVPRPGADSFESGGADEVLAVVDNERGVLLRVERRFQGAPFMVTELVEVEFDADFPDDLFAPPPGTTPRPAEEVYARPERVSLEEAARRSSYTVLAPKVPSGWTMEVDVAHDGVYVLLSDPEWSHWVRIIQGPAVPADSLEWVPVEGEPYLVFDGREVKFEQEGTPVRISGDVDLDALLAIARSLRPAPTELPPLE